MTRRCCRQGLEPLRRKRWPLRHVGHQRQRLGKPPNRHVQLKRRGIDVARRGEIGEQRVERVGDLDGRSRAGALGEHRRRETRDSIAAARVGIGADRHEQAHLHDGQFVLLDDPDAEAIAQLALDDHWRHRRRGSSAGPLDAVVRAARGSRNRDRDEDSRHEPSVHVPRARHFSVHSESDATSLTKIRLPETVGWAQVALSATVYRFSASNPFRLLLATIS